MENQSLDLKKLQESIFVKKSEGTEVNYFLYPEFEVHRNSLPSGVIQEWHAHTQVEEVIVCTKGSFIIETIENQKLISTCVEQGDVARVRNSVHRLRNDEENSAEFIVFRFLPDGEEKQEQIKRDKRTYTEDQIQLLLSNKE
ncbi:cupin domain-containing protein [Enterococcus sp. BWR-S5]|uniref:cupin domain-containing protein n=1 Tax=Enterococcus sp. BWR-S5 TaxID=2787714 RepID=UPI001924A64D|nr:cupin domain-containing protein [Enterococcus sp. BWR-S5]MBL1224524.1 cupin domain-containing protein [Enterococcus sp. BWR-S5]